MVVTGAGAAPEPAGTGAPAGATRWVAVAVATVWRDPGRPRDIDLPALAQPAALREWLAALDVEARKDLVGRIETQVLLGQPVVVLEDHGPWVRVAVPEQEEPGAPAGYPGWMPAWQLTGDPAWAAVAPGPGTGPAPGGRPTVTVAALTAWLYHRPHPQARWMEVSFGTRLPVVAEPGADGDRDGAWGDGTGQAGDGWIAVAVPRPPLGAAAAGGGWQEPPSGGEPGRAAGTGAVSGPAPAAGAPAPTAGALAPGAGAPDPAAAGAGPSRPAEDVAGSAGSAGFLRPVVAWIRREDVRFDAPQGAGLTPSGAAPVAGTAPVAGAAPVDGAAPAAGTAPAAAAPVSGLALLETARRFLGLPYLWGGTSGFGVDCSGFVYLVHRFHGILIPRDAAPQRDHGGGLPVERADLQPGDLVFFAHDGGKGAVHHVGMYAGAGRMIHAPSSGRVVEEIPLDTPPYGEKYAGARRYHGRVP